MGYLWFRLRLWCRETRSALIWKAAYALPRSVALIAFVRVYAVLGTFSSDYDNAYKAFEAGEGN